MPDYRLYVFGDRGDVSSAEHFVANDDAAAVIKVREMKRDARKCEIWLGDKLVTTLGAQDLG